MLALRPQSKIFSKIVRTNSGELVKAYFLVTEYQGKFYVKLLKTEKLETETVSSETSETLLLPSGCEQCSYDFVSVSSKPVLSPFKDFSFFYSQLTRAPSALFS